MLQKKHTIVYAEDDPDDVQFVRECFREYDQKIELLIAQNGSEALTKLNELNSKGITPCLVILDINMPLMDGRQALVRIKGNPDLKNIPVVIFTTSSNTLDKDFATKWGADFISKPLRYSDVEGLAEEFVRRCDGPILK